MNGDGVKSEERGVRGVRGVKGVTGLIVWKGDHDEEGKAGEEEERVPSDAFGGVMRREAAE